MHRTAKETKVYDRGIRRVDLRSLATHDLYVALVGSGYKPKATDEFWSDVKAHEVTGAGYTANGQALTSKVVTDSEATHTMRLAAANLVWSDSTITARYGILYDRTPATDETRPLLVYIDFGVPDMHSDDGAFRVNWDPTNGILSAVRS
jgi:hypothetical protein